MTDTRHRPIGVVTIGRNEGDRLRRCLRSLGETAALVVYVDSGSTDGSVEFARSIGVEVLELDLSRPFSMARARNTGWQHLLRRRPDLKFVQFIDGDCVLEKGWISAAISSLEENPHAAVVCGRRRETRPRDSRYNRFCDIEWNTPLGEARSCGGDFLVRTHALRDSHGMNEALIAGEEPEWCFRLRQAGWKILRIDVPMSLHDAAILRFGQWWKRSRRTGYGALDVWTRCRQGFPDEASEELPYDHLLKSSCAWIQRCASVGGILFVIATAGVWIATGEFFLSLLAGFLAGGSGIAALVFLQGWRIARTVRKRHPSGAVRLSYGIFTMIAKAAQMLGQRDYLRDRRKGRAARLIEYKATPAGGMPWRASRAYRRWHSRSNHAAEGEIRGGDRLSLMSSLVYIAAEYPKLSETFVYREVLGLRAFGLRVPVVSVRPSADAPSLLPGAAFEDRVDLYGSGRLALIKDALTETCTHPRRAARTLGTSIRDALWPGEKTSGKTRAKGVFHALAALALSQRIRPLRPSHLHAQMAHVPASIARHAAVQLGVSFSFTGHAADLFRDRSFLVRKLRDASHVHCISNWHRDFYRTRVERPDADYPIVRCGIDPVDYPFTPKTVPDAPPVLLGVGRLVRKKGFDVLLEAIAELVLNGTDLRAKILGDGPEFDSLRALADSLGIAERVEFGGPVDNPGVTEAMRTADLFVLPCRVAGDGDKDGIPVVLMEAMARGLPVLSGDLPAIRELVVSGDTGLLVPPGDSVAVRDEILRMLNPSFPRQQYLSRARHRVEEEFFLDANRDRILAALKDHGVLAPFPETP